MSDEHRDTGTGWPEPTRVGAARPADGPTAPTQQRTASEAGGVTAATAEDAVTPMRAAAEDAAERTAGPQKPGPRPARVPDPDGGARDDDARETGRAERPTPPARRRAGSASVVIGLLLALLGFTLVLQLRGDSLDSDLAAMREDDLVRLQSDLTAQEDRLQKEINDLEARQRQLQSGAEGRRAALGEATKRADELAILAGTVAATGPGIEVRMIGGKDGIKASDVLNAVEELRGAGAEAMQIAGADGPAVRIVASTAFVDADGDIQVGTARLAGPYTLTVIGSSRDMRVALEIPDGLVASVRNDGGNVTIDERDTVGVTALSAPVTLEHARPVS
jgi:uncharacterized protein YlxW (UPF0749 family)